MNTTMHATIIQHRSSRGVTWYVKIEGEPMCTKFAARRWFRTESAARKEVTRLVGADVVFNVVTF